MEKLRVIEAFQQNRTLQTSCFPVFLGTIFGTPMSRTLADNRPQNTSMVRKECYEMEFIKLFCTHSRFVYYHIRAFLCETIVELQIE